jgi:hypothetical protein
MSDLEPGVQLSPDAIAAMERLRTSPPPKPRNTMSEQHEATSEQWAQIERTAEDVHGDGCSALLELRTRVEALEATQHAHVDTSSLWQPVRSITPLNGDPSKRLPDPQPGKQPRVFAADEVAPIVVPSPTIQPVPVSERPWEREGWCDVEGRCWMGHPGDAEFIPSWRLCRPEDAPSMTCSLPHYALPTPTP